ncbi:MAG: ribokinase [Janthinobacterium lividum]
MITVFGSINADLIFKLDRIPVPGQTLIAHSLIVQPGGKGANQAVAAARDGATVRMVGAVGDDALAETALAGLRQTAISLDDVRVVPGHSTGCASICTDRDGRNQIAVALGANGHLSAAQVSAAMLGPASTLLLQMEAPRTEIEALIGCARQAGGRIILNLAPALPLDRVAMTQVDILIVNEDEAADLGTSLGVGAEAAALREALGIVVICTLGASGAEAATADGVVQIPAPQIEAVDTTAAGDCFAGVLASGLDAGLDLPAAMRRAVVAASLACLREGSQTSLPNRADTDAAYAGSNFPAE